MAICKREEGRREGTKCLSEELHYRKMRILWILWISVQYGEILHKIAEIFSQAEGKGKCCTQVQCLTILDTDPGNVRFITHLFVHCCLPNNLFIWPYIRGLF